MNQQKMFKVLSHVEKKGGGGFWMRCGTAFVNKDNSINVYLDAMPKKMDFTLYEFDENELRKREDRDDLMGARSSAPPQQQRHDGVPF